MQLLTAIFLTSLLPLTTSHPALIARNPEPEPEEVPDLTRPYGPGTWPTVRTFTYDSCEMQVNSRTIYTLRPDVCWDATPQPVFNMARGFGSIKANYPGQVKLGEECALVIYDNRECRDGAGQGKSRVIPIGNENKMECFNVEMGEGVKGFGVEWVCGKVPKA